MYKSLLLVLFVCCMTLQTNAQHGKTPVYDINANGMQQLEMAIKEAADNGKHVLVKIGYNQCPWCIELNKFVQADEKIDSLMKADYVFVKINYSKENRNYDVMDKLDFPQRFGFPVLVVLNDRGKRIHTQNSLYLEKDKSYDAKRIINFLKAWNKKALSPESYKRR